MAFIAWHKVYNYTLIYNSRNYMAFIASKYGTNIMIYLYITNLCGQIILQFVLPITDNLYILMA